MVYVLIGCGLLSIGILLIAASRWQKNRTEQVQGNIGNMRTIAQYEDEILGDKRTLSQDADPLIQQSARMTRKEENTSTGSHLLVMYVLAEADNAFAGYDLLQGLLSAGLRFGDMKIFHRHKTLQGTGGILFSVASATEPGTFDMQKMGGFSCKGLCLFMRITDTPQDAITMRLMVSTAKQLASDLGGIVCDQYRQPIQEEATLLMDDE